MGVGRGRVAVARVVLGAGVAASLVWAGTGVWRMVVALQAARQSAGGIGAVSTGLGGVLLEFVVTVGTIAALLRLAMRWRPVSAPRNIGTLHLFSTGALLASIVASTMWAAQFPSPYSFAAVFIVYTS